MFDLNTLSEFSRTHCIAICAFLVPANLAATLTTMIFTALHRPRVQVWRAVSIAIALAVVMALHVFSWWSIGVVMAPTYILLSLATVCMAINIWAIAHSSTQARLLRALWSAIARTPIGGQLKLPPIG